MIDLGILASSYSVSLPFGDYWFSRYNMEVSSGSSIIKSAATSSTGETYICFPYLQYIYAFKIDSSGSVSWSKKINTGYSYAGETRVSIGNKLYILANETSGRVLFLALDLSNGAISSQKYVGTSAAEFDVDLYSVVTDTSSNIYSLGTIVEDLNASPLYEYKLFCKYNESLSTLTDYKVSRDTQTTSTFEQVDCASIDETGDIWLLGYSAVNISGVDYIKGFIQRISSSLQMEYSGYTTETRYQFNDSTIIASNMYAISGNSLVKFNLTSTPTMSLKSSVSGTNLYGITKDSSGYIYTYGTRLDGGAAILKMDSNFNIIWQRYIKVGTNTYINSLAIVGDQMYICFSSDSNLYACNLPSDGSYTGSYTISTISPAVLIEYSAYNATMTPKTVDTITTKSKSVQSSTASSYTLSATSASITTTQYEVEF